jgi:hypothetical protein
MDHKTTQVEESEDKGGPSVPDVEDTYILDSAKQTVYDRPDQHGEPEDSFAIIADFWSNYLGIEIEPHEVCDLFILMKVARNREGVYHEDNPEDIAGYAENYARLRGEK